jgi:hypothetical protein
LALAISAATAKPVRVRTAIRIWDGRFGIWDGRFGTRHGRFGTWDGRLGIWDERFRMWDGRLGTWRVMGPGTDELDQDG